ncbi:sortase [Bifidobacterium longum]
MRENNAAMPDDTSANDNVSPARPEPTAFVPTPFDEVIDISDLVAERRRLQRNLWAMRIITIVLLIAAIAVACFPLALQFESDRNLAATTATTAKEVAGWPYPQAKDKLTAARAYNKKLAESGQPILGEAVDPFSAAQGGSQASGEDSASKKDKEYQSLLNTGNGVMGAIKVPKQSINLPIYHGTSEEALASGAGHLYGTSLPVGGKSTHSVITGHRVAIPMPAPEPNDVLDARNIALGVGLGILAAGLFIIWLARRHKAARIIRHGAFWPWMRRKGESANDTLA